MNIKLVRIFSLLIMFLTVTGCGFHLRGSMVSVSHLNHIFIQTNGNYNEFTQILKGALRSNDVKLARSPRQARATLRIINTQFSQRLQQVSANTQTKIYLIKYTIDYELMDRRGKTIYGPKQVITRSTYSASDTQLLADSNVLHMQKRQMIREAINLLFIQLSSQQARVALARQR